MSVKNATIRVKAEGLESLDKAASAIKKLDQVMVQSRREMERTAKVVQQQDKADLNSNQAVQAKIRLHQDIVRMEKQQALMAFERQALFKQEQINAQARIDQTRRLKTEVNGLNSALSGFGGKMILGMAAGRLASSLAGSTEAGRGIGEIASGLFFGGPLIGAAVGIANVIGSIVDGIREVGQETRAWENELAKVASTARLTADSVLPISALGIQHAKERADIANKAEAERKEHEHQIVGDTPYSWLYNWKFRDISPAGRELSEKEEALYRQSQHLAHQQIYQRNDLKPELDAQIAQNRAERAIEVERARAGMTPGVRRQAMLDRLQTAANEAKLEFQIAQERKKLLAAQADERAADANANLNAQQMARDVFERDAAEKLAAQHEEDSARERSRSFDFIFGEKERLSPIIQLNEYRLRLEKAVNDNATTMDEARTLLARKMGEVLGSLYRPGFAQVWDSRQRINIAALHPTQSPAFFPAYADGTDNHPGGMALVGEKGPELVSLPKGSKVHRMGAGADARLRNIAENRWYSPTTGLHEIKSSAYMNAYWARHPRHESVGRPMAMQGGADNPIFDAITPRQGGAHNPIFDSVSAVGGGWHHGEGYYKRFGYRAMHHDYAGPGAGGGSGRDLNHMIDPLTGRPLSVGSAMVGGAGGGGGPIGASQGEAGNLASMVEQILNILRGGH